jgi:hypothetical protein
MLYSETRADPPEGRRKLAALVCWSCALVLDEGRGLWECPVVPEADSLKVHCMTLCWSSRCKLLLPFIVSVGGCTGVQLAAPPDTGSLTASAHPASNNVASPVEVYSRVARGALKCWFGPEGSLKKTHVFHAKVDPPDKGGTADIGVHTREAGSSHGVLRAFGVTITPSGSGSLIEAQNVRFPEPQAAIMIADVNRWASGKSECAIVGMGGWDAARPTTPPEASQVAQTGKAKAAPKR